MAPVEVAMKRRFSMIGFACAALAGGCGEEAGGSSTRDPGSSTGAQSSTAGSGGNTAASGSESAGVGGSGGAGASNPAGGSGGLEVLGTIFVSKDYQVENPADVGADSVGEMVYVPGGGFQGSSCWELHLFGDVYDEDHVGWTPNLGDDQPVVIPEGATQRMFVGHLLYISQPMADLVASTNLGGKMLDAMMYEGPGDPQTRQVVAFDYKLDYGRVANYLVKGGAGGPWAEQLGPTLFDFRDYADQWLWIEYEFNADQRYTALWVKTQDGTFTGAQDAPLMRREADDPADWVWPDGSEPPYDYTSLGWATPGHLWGYWGQLLGVPFDENTFIRLDKLVISDGWIVPPQL
jgi:hypothetical protein